jgi:hypothetical protein
MQRFNRKLLALSLAVLLLPLPLYAEEGPKVTGTVEVGGEAVNIQDDNARVNEYTDSRSDDGVNAVGKFDVDVDGGGGMRIDAVGDIRGGHDQIIDGTFELSRAIRGNFNYNVLQHQLEHDEMNYMDASIARPGSSSDPADPNPWPGTLGPDAVPGFMLIDVDANGNEYVVKPVAVTTYAAAVAAESVYLAANPASRIAQTGGAAVYGEDLLPGQDFSIVRREYSTGVEVQAPALPNLVFNVDYRREHREGTEQSIASSKCASCHLTGGSKDIDEVTSDVKVGVTGKFGQVTLQYEFSDRQFDNNARDTTNVYDPVNKPGTPLSDKTFDNRVSYDYFDGALASDTTPESEKQTHLVKARVDMPRQTTVLGSFVNSKITSDKTDEPGIFTINKSTLRTTYDGYGLKATTRFGGLKLSTHAKIEKIDSDNVTPTFYPITAPGAPAAGLTFGSPPVTSYTPPHPIQNDIGRDNLTTGIDAVYRLMKGTTLRLGYEFKSQDRDDDEFGETKTHTAKAQVNYRANRTLSARAGYTYQDIDDPFANYEAADVPLTTNTFPTGVTGNSAAYGTTYYAAREADLSNQPDEVHEVKLATTWSPMSQFSATVSYRYRDESNDLNKSNWEQDTHTPSVTLWYAANDKLNITAAYNYFDQRSKTAFCQGFYDG